MNKTYILAILALLVVFSVTAVSASTLIAGKIYNSDYSDVIAGADVDATCNNITLSETSESDGTYAIPFDSEDCEIGDEVTVYAEKDGMSGEKTGTVLDGEIFDIPVNDLAIVNVPLIPEFGIVLGTLTAISAIGIFFFVRRK